MQSLSEEWQGHWLSCDVPAGYELKVVFLPLQNQIKTLVNSHPIASITLVWKTLHAGNCNPASSLSNRLSTWNNKMLT